jgi:hypothetical protein
VFQVIAGHPEKLFFKDQPHQNKKIHYKLLIVKNLCIFISLRTIKQTFLNQIKSRNLAVADLQCGMGGPKGPFKNKK